MWQTPIIRILRFCVIFNIEGDYGNVRVISILYIRKYKNFPWNLSGKCYWWTFVINYLAIGVVSCNFCWIMLGHLQRSALISYYLLWVKLARICTTFPKDLIVIWSQITDYMLINSVLFSHLGIGMPLNNPLSDQGSHYLCTLLQQYNVFP